MTPNPQALAALQAMRGPAPEAAAPAGMAPVDPKMDMPMAVDKPTKELFLDRSLFSGTPVKKGQEVTVSGKVTTIGASIGFMPTSIEPAGSADEEGAEQFDEDLDTEVGDEAE